MDWNKNYKIDFLKSITNVFKINEKEFVFGQFSKIKERDLVKYLDSDSILYSDSSCIVWRLLKRDSFRYDFRGKKIIFEKGDVIVDRFTAANVDQGLNLFNDFLNKVGRKNIIVNLFEENSITKKVLFKNNFHYLSTKIMSTSEIVGLYSNKLNIFSNPEIEEKEKESLCLASKILDQDCSISGEDLKKIKKELLSYSGFQQHYSHYNKRKSWLAFSVKGYSKEDPGFIIKPDEMSKKWKKENKDLLNNKSEYTSISHLFPNTIKFAERFGKTERLRFMKLLSGGELSRHADITNKNAGVSSGRTGRFHLPIISHQKVKYFAWGLRGDKIEREFSANELFYLDQRKPHRVVNDSPIDRINLVMDVIL